MGNDTTIAYCGHEVTGDWDADADTFTVEGMRYAANPDAVCPACESAGHAASFDADAPCPDCGTDASGPIGCADCGAALCDAHAFSHNPAHAVGVFAI